MGTFISDFDWDNAVVGNPTNATNAITTAAATANNSLTINTDGTTTFSNDVTVDGLGLVERLAIIETVLGLPKRNVELEAKYPHLKELYNKHVDSCKVVDATKSKYTEEMEKLRTFEILQNDDNSA